MFKNLYLFYRKNNEIIHRLNRIVVFYEITECGTRHVLTAGFGHFGGHILPARSAGLRAMPAAPFPLCLLNNIFRLLLCLLLATRKSRDSIHKTLLRKKSACRVPRFP